MVVYENIMDVEDFNYDNPGFFKPVGAQGWDVALMTGSEMKVTLPQIHEFYFTLDKVNEGHYKAKVDRHDFHLQLSHIAKVVGVAVDKNKVYFDNMKPSGSSLTKPMKPRYLKWLAFIF